MKKKKVLIPLDGSDFSKEILTYVKDFLDASNHHLILFQVAEKPLGVLVESPTVTQAGDYLSQIPPQPQPDYRVFPSQQEQSVEANLKAKLLSEVKQLEEAGFKVESEVGFGNPAQEILDYVKHESMDMVAMATHGRTGLSRLVMGSVAEKLIHNLAIPVLLIRPAALTAIKG